MAGPQAEEEHTEREEQGCSPSKVGITSWYLELNLKQERGHNDFEWLICIPFNFLSWEQVASQAKWATSYECGPCKRSGNPEKIWVPTGAGWQQWKKRTYPDSLPCRLFVRAGRRAVSSTHKVAGFESWWASQPSGRRKAIIPQSTLFQ